MSDKKETLLEAINKLIPNDIKLAIKDLKAKFDAMPPAVAAPAAAPANPIEVKLKDGTSLSVDKMEVGGIANVISEVGSVLAEAKDYEAEDGTIITVGVDGVISNIKPVEVAAPELNQVTPEMLAALSARLAQVETKFAESQAANTVLKTSLAAVNEAQKVTLSAVELILSAPAGEPIEKPVQKNHKLSNLSNLGDTLNKKP